MNSNAYRKQPAISSNIISAAPGWDVISDVSFALLCYKSLCPSEDEIPQQQRNELAGHRWHDGTRYAKEQDNYCEVFISNRSRAVVDEEYPTFRWKCTLMSWTHEIKMIATHDRKQTHKFYLTQIIFPTFYQTAMSTLYNWHTATAAFTKPSRAIGWNNNKQNSPTLKKKYCCFPMLLLREAILP